MKCVVCDLTPIQLRANEAVPHEHSCLSCGAVYDYEPGEDLVPKFDWFLVPKLKNEAYGRRLAERAKKRTNRP